MLIGTHIVNSSKAKGENARILELQSREGCVQRRLYADSCWCVFGFSLQETEPSHQRKCAFQFLAVPFCLSVRLLSQQQPISPFFRIRSPDYLAHHASASLFFHLSRSKSAWPVIKGWVNHLQRSSYSNMPAIFRLSMT